MVRIARQGNRISQYYSDVNYGGKRKSLAAAKQAYEELVEELGPPENATRDRLTSRNTTGVVGVHLAYTYDNRYPGCEYYAYCASWVTEERKRQKASFAWKKFGEDKSLDLAIIAREHQLTDHDEILAIYDKTVAGKKSKRKTKASRPAKKSVKRTTKKPAKKPAKKSIKKSAKKPVKKSARKPVKKQAKRSVKKTAKRSAKKASKKAIAKRR